MQPEPDTPNPVPDTADTPETTDRFVYTEEWIDMWIAGASESLPSG